MFLAAYLLYELARTLGTGSRSEAVANAHRVLGPERAAGLDLESGTGNHFVIDVAAGLVVTLVGFASACALRVPR